MNRKLQASSVKHQAPESRWPGFSAHRSVLRAGVGRLSVAGLSLVMVLGLLGFLSCPGQAQVQSAEPRCAAPDVRMRAHTSEPKKEPNGPSPDSLGGKWGYVDAAGKLIIGHEFDAAGRFFEGLAAVRIGDRETGKWGFIDTCGKVVINPKFDHVEAFFVEGLAAVEVGGQYGYIDKTGSPVTQSLFSSRLWFSEGLAAVWFADGDGYVDTTGKFVIEPQFHDAQEFSEGLAAVEVGDSWGYIDKTGKFVITPRFAWARDFSEGLAAVEADYNLWGYVDRTGRMVIKPQFEDVRGFHEGLAAVTVAISPHAQYGYIDKTGKFVIRPRFELAGDFSEGSALVGFQNGDGGYIDKRGKSVPGPTK